MSFILSPYMRIRRKKDEKILQIFHERLPFSIEVEGEISTKKLVTEYFKKVTKEDYND